MKADLAWTRAAVLEGRRPWVGLWAGRRNLTSALNARIAIVLAVVVGQLWGLKLALDAWFGGQAQALRVVLAFQLLSTVVSLVVSRTPRLPETGQ